MYLTEAELTTYTSMPGVTLQDVVNASALIDAYKGTSFLEKTYTEFVKLQKKRMGSLTLFRGKLLHYPRASITSITSKTQGYFGDTITTYDTSSLSFDSDDEPYFTFYSDTTAVHAIFPQAPPLMLTVEYKAGYKTTEIPEKLKVICGLICDGIKQNGGFRMYKSRTDYDCTIAFSDNEDPVLTNNICRMIDSIVLA
jgi:hypothetical protein